MPDFGLFKPRGDSPVAGGPPLLDSWCIVESDPTNVLVKPAGTIAYHIGGLLSWRNRDGTAAGWETNGVPLVPLAQTEPAALEGAALTDASVTIQPHSDAVSQYQDRVPLTALRTTTLGVVGAFAPGMVVRIVRAANVAGMRSIANGGTGGGVLFTFPAAAAKALSATFMYNGAYWLLTGWQWVRGLP